MAEIVLNVEVRDQTGTGGARAVRTGGKVPGILYGGDRGPVPIAVAGNEFRKALYTGKLLGHLVTLKYGEQTQPVIARDVQFHPVTDEPMQFDLLRVDEHQMIKIAIPVHFKNHEDSPGLKRGGTLNVVRHDVELNVPADSIPEELVEVLKKEQWTITPQSDLVKWQKNIFIILGMKFQLSRLKFFTNRIL